MYTRNIAPHFEVVWFETPQVQLEISAECGVGQRPWKSPQSSVRSLVWWLTWEGGDGAVGISSGVSGHEDPLHHVGMEVF